jgi:hypothetical protein
VSTDREVTRIVRSWLEEGVNALPDRVLDAVLDQVPATPQRRHSWPAWRLPHMNTQIRIAIAAAAVVVLALVVVNVLPKSSGVGGPAATPSPTPGSLTGAIVPMNPGTYLAADPFLLRATFTLPAGWEGGIAGPYLVALDQAPRGSGSVNFSIFGDVYANPCHYNGLVNPPVGPSVDNLATALASLPGLTATTPTAVTLGGYQGKQLTLTAPASFAGCTLSSDGQFRIWGLLLGATNDMSAGERDQIWILDVGGRRLVIDAPQPTDETAAEAAEVQGVLNSIHLAPAPPVSSPAASSTP